MIPCVITDASIMFVARGRPWTLAADHPHFATIREMLEAEGTGEDDLVRLADVTVAVSDATQGHVQLTEAGVFVDGEAMPAAWMDKAIACPTELGVLLVHPGDRVRVEGDEDAPDGTYTVGDVDNTDTAKRVYVESEDDYFGFVANHSIKEIVQ